MQVNFGIFLQWHVYIGFILNHNRSFSTIYRGWTCLSSLLIDTGFQITNLNGWNKYAAKESEKRRSPRSELRSYLTHLVVNPED